MNEIIDSINKCDDPNIRAVIKQLLQMIQSQNKTIETINKDLDNITDIISDNKPQNKCDISDIKLQIKKLSEKIDRDSTIMSEDMIRYIDNNLCEINTRINERLMYQDGKILVLSDKIDMLKNNTTNTLQRIKDDVTIKSRDTYSTMTNSLKKIENTINSSTTPSRSKSILKFK